MRPLCLFKDESKGREFSRFLTEKGIGNECDSVPVTDWGSDHYGESHCQIWVINEDDIDKAQEWYDKYLEDPSAPEFAVKHARIKEMLEPEQQKQAAREGMAKIQKAATSWQNQPIGFVTLYLIVICSILFVWSNMFAPRSADGKSLGVMSPIQRSLMYDYPQAMQVLTRLVKVEPAVTADEPDDQVSKEAAHLITQLENTPVWTGLYEKVVLYLQGRGSEISWDQPMFEKIRQGEVWRLFTPALLHSGLIHILFNMLWLLVLGKEMEGRLGPMRFLLFVLITGIVSNTAQYLMSGPQFVGISGVLCAQLAFIVTRQQRAPWEGYQLQRSTTSFLFFFIAAMLGFQLVSFTTEVIWNYPLASRIANTAHISGAWIGFVLGHMEFFSWKSTS